MTTTTLKFGPHWIKDPGCQNQPLFNIPPDNVVFDELHLMLRVTDRLEQGPNFRGHLLGRGV